MPTAEGNGLRFEYESFGAPDAPAILLIQGLGMPAAMWPDVFVETLVAEGYRVVTFDNRDCGGSSRMADAGIPNVARAMTRALLRRPVTAPYNLDDMAEDTRAVLDAAIAEGADWADQVICAWGSHGAHLNRGAAVAAVLRATAKPLYHLGLTQAGAPKHPLYIGYSVQPALWP